MPLYLTGIVRGGDHHTCGIVELADGEIEAIGGRHAQFYRVDALVGNAMHQAAASCGDEMRISRPTAISGTFKY